MNKLVFLTLIAFFIAGMENRKFFGRVGQAGKKLVNFGRKIGGHIQRGREIYNKGRDVFNSGREAYNQGRDAYRQGRDLWRGIRGRRSHKLH